MSPKTVSFSYGLQGCPREAAWSCQEKECKCRRREADQGLGRRVHDLLEGPAETGRAPSMISPMLVHFDMDAAGRHGGPQGPDVVQTLGFMQTGMKPVRTGIKPVLASRCSRRQRQTSSMDQGGMEIEAAAVHDGDWLPTRGRPCVRWQAPGCPQECGVELPADP